MNILIGSFSLESYDSIVSIATVTEKPSYIRLLSNRLDMIMRNIHTIYGPKQQSQYLNDTILFIASNWIKFVLCRLKIITAPL